MQKLILALALAAAPVRRGVPRNKILHVTSTSAKTTKNAASSVTGHTVIVHKGCPAENPECTNGGDRIGCCVLA